MSGRGIRFVDNSLCNVRLDEVKRGRGDSKDRISLPDKVATLTYDELLPIMIGQEAFNEVIGRPLGDRLLNLVSVFKKEQDLSKVISSTSTFPRYTPDLPFESLCVPLGGMDTFLSTAMSRLPQWLAPPKSQRRKVVEFLAQRLLSWREEEKLLPPGMKYADEPFTLAFFEKLSKELKMPPQAAKDLIYGITTNLMNFAVLYILHLLRMRVKVGISPEGFARYYDIDTYNAAKADGKLSATVNGMESSMDESMDERSSTPAKPKPKKRRRDDSPSNVVEAVAEPEKKRPKKRLRKSRDSNSPAASTSSSSRQVDEELVVLKPKPKKVPVPIELDSESENDPAETSAKVAFDLKRVKREKKEKDSLEFNPLKVKKEKLEYDPKRVKVEKTLSGMPEPETAEKTESASMLSYLAQILSPAPVVPVETETSSVMSNDNGSSTSGGANVGDVMKRAKLKQVADQLSLDATSDPNMSEGHKEVFRTMTRLYREVFELNRKSELRLESQLELLKIDYRIQEAENDKLKIMLKQTDV